MLAITYIPAIYIHPHTQDRFNNCTVHASYRTLVTAPVSRMVMKMRNIAPRARFKPIPLAFQASVPSISSPRFSDVGTPSTPICPSSSLRES